MLESLSSKVSDYDFSESLPPSWGDVVLEVGRSTLAAERARVSDWYDAARKRVEELIRETAEDNIPKTSVKKGSVKTRMSQDFEFFFAEPLTKGGRVDRKWIEDNYPDFYAHLTANVEPDENIGRFFKDLNWRVQEDSITTRCRTEHRRLLEMMSRSREALQSTIR